MELDSTVSCKLQQSVDSHVEKLNYSVVKSVRRCQPIYFYILSLFLFYYQGGFFCRYLDGGARLLQKKAVSCLILPQPPWPYPRSW